MREILFIVILSLFSSCLVLQDGASYPSVQNKKEGVDDEVKEKIIPLLSLENKGDLTISKDLMGDYTIRDNKGNRTTISKDLSGDYTIRGNKGGRTTVSKSLSGDYTIRDNKGNRKTVSKDAMGDYTCDFGVVKIANLYFID